MFHSQRRETPECVAITRYLLVDRDPGLDSRPGRSWTTEGPGEASLMLQICNAQSQLSSSTGS
jgi:hypothetical protein